MDRTDIINEANNHFERNYQSYKDREHCSFGTKLFSCYYNDNINSFAIDRFLEIGCSTGYNLIFLKKKFNFECYGIDPSDKAISYGIELSKQKNVDIELLQGYSDNIPYDKHFFDAVNIAFCTYQVDRSLLFATFCEMDRVLKNGGVCIITDFDTPMRYMCDNKHNANVPTWKENYADRLLSYGYTLIYKKMYSHESLKFDCDISSRVSTQIFLKEKINDIYFYNRNNNIK